MGYLKILNPKKIHLEHSNLIALPIFRLHECMRVGATRLAILYDNLQFHQKNNEGVQYANKVSHDLVLFYMLSFSLVKLNHCLFKTQETFCCYNENLNFRPHKGLMLKL